MVRDEHDLDKEETTEGGPEVKLDMKYNRTQNQVAVTVMHAKNLVRVLVREKEKNGRGEGKGEG